MSSLETGLAALRMFNSKRDRLRVSDLVTEMGLPKSSASRLLTTLAQCGFIDRCADAQGYQVGYELSRLGNRYRSQNPAQPIAEEVLQKLVPQYPVTGYLATLVGDDMLVLRALESDAIIRVVVSEGSRMPPYVTAIGRVLLARLPDPELLARLPAKPAWPPLSYKSSRLDLLSELQMVRARGWAELDDWAKRGVGALAVSVSAESAPPIGMAMAFMVHQVDAALQQKMLTDLMNAAREIGAKLHDPYWLNR